MRDKVVFESLRLSDLAIKSRFVVLSGARSGSAGCGADNRCSG